jgi:TolB-like protein
MKKTSILVLLSLILCAAAAAKDNLAILPFTGGAAGEGETIAELFSFNNELNRVFSPIPRTSIAQAIGNEQSFQAAAGMTDPDTIAAIGRQLGANYVVAGNITRLGRLNLLIISILKIDELRQIAGDLQTYAQIEEIQGKLPQMARNIIAAAQINPPQLDKLAVVPVELGGNIDSRVADTLAQILSINLIRSGKYLVYPRTATLQQVQSEYKTQLSGVTADEHLVNMGKGVNPQFVLSVVARRLGNQNMFNASIINLESGVQDHGGSVNYNTLDDGIQIMEDLARELTGGQAAWTQQAPPLDLDAEALAAAAGAAAESAAAEAAAAKRSGGKGFRQSGGAVFGYGLLNLALGLGSFAQGDPGGGIFTLLTYGAAAGLIYWETTLAYDDELAGIPGGAGLGVASFAVLYGLIRPAVFNQSRPLAAALDGINVSPAPAAWNSDRAGVRVSYSFKF